VANGRRRVMARTRRILVVDDSPVARLYVRHALSDLEGVVLEEACDAISAWQHIQTAPPDCIVLDIDLPGLDGISLLRELMQQHPVPVVIHSSLARVGSALAVEALAAGAVAAVHKPLANGGRANARAELQDSVHAALLSRPRALTGTASDPTARQPSLGDGALCAMGLSTGGVQALTEVLRSWPAGAPPLLVVQHMPEEFTKQLAAQLAERFKPLQIAEASDGELLRPGMVRIAPGSRHLLLGRTDQGLPCCVLNDDAPVSWHRPSVDVLFESLATDPAAKVRAVLMTGMGDDGARGLLALRNAGAHTAVQDEASCVVFGMPQAAWRLGAAQTQLSLNRVAGWLLNPTTAASDSGGASPGHSTKLGAVARFRQD
jgi:two-component system, chemotaxis family, protein-glutamate methylesterase/glutaminase